MDNKTKSPDPSIVAGNTNAASRIIAPPVFPASKYLKEETNDSKENTNLPYAPSVREMSWAIKEKYPFFEEPIFILRAKDVLSLETLFHYAHMSAQQDCDPNFMFSLGQLCEIFRGWQDKNQDKVRRPN